MTPSKQNDDLKKFFKKARLSHISSKNSSKQVQAPTEAQRHFLQITTPPEHIKEKK